MIPVGSFKEQKFEETLISISIQLHKSKNTNSDVNDSLSNAKCPTLNKR